MGKKCEIEGDTQIEEKTRNANSRQDEREREMEPLIMWKNDTTK